jgi:Domain of unknown function (DUF4157)
LIAAAIIFFLRQLCSKTTSSKEFLRLHLENKKLFCRSTIEGVSRRLSFLRNESAPCILASLESAEAHMKKTVQPNPQQPQASAAESSGRSLRQAGADGRTPSHLSQLAATINQSPRVQTQLKLARQLQGGAQGQKHTEPGGEINQALQRKGPDEKKKKTAPPKGKLEEKKPVLRKSDGSLQEESFASERPAQKMTAQLEEASSPNRTGLPDRLKAGVENLSGMSMEDVKIHYNSGKPAQLNALAYAQGTDIHVAPGQEKHLAHEAWHIAQQKQGRVQPTTQMKAGVPVNDDPKLEREADVMGAQALQRMANAADQSDRAQEEADGHAEGCACPTCSAPRQLIGRRPAQLLSSGNGVAQLECDYCKALGKDADHSYRNCPYLNEEEEEESTPTEPVDSKEGKEKAPGWKKTGSSGASTGRISRSGTSHHDIGKDKSKSKKERDMTGGRKGKKRVYR